VENETGRELEGSEKNERSYWYALLKNQCIQSLKSCVWEKAAITQQLYRKSSYIHNCKAAITQQNNAGDHKRNENAVAGVGRLDIPVVTKSVIAENNKVEIELAPSLWWLNSNR